MIKDEREGEEKVTLTMSHKIMIRNLLKRPTSAAAAATTTAAATTATAAAAAILLASRKKVLRRLFLMDKNYFHKVCCLLSKTVKGGYNFDLLLKGALAKGKESKDFPL